MNEAKLSIFDLDGTLHHTEKALLPAIRLAMIDLGFPPAGDEAINSLYGEPLEVFCTELMGSVEHYREFRDGIRRYQRETLPKTGALYPGTRMMLETAREDGWQMAVCSNAGVDYIELVTCTLGIREFFSALKGRDGNASKTSRVRDLLRTFGEPGTTVMVGDRYHDIEAAREAGVTSVGCAYGYGSPREIGESDHIAASPGEVSVILRNLPGGLS